MVLAVKQSEKTKYSECGRPSLHICTRRDHSDVFMVIYKPGVNVSIDIFKPTYIYYLSKIQCIVSCCLIASKIKLINVKNK